MGGSVLVKLFTGGRNGGIIAKVISINIGRVGPSL